mmetsp:Transcript_17483/g.41629  ORF Transcript_17483/g.41629 Transcript_17483/m.41629 type:complete len:222 (+) Transcript_17483:392-1057(+)
MFRFGFHCAAFLPCLVHPWAVHLPLGRAALPAATRCCDKDQQAYDFSAALPCGCAGHELSVPGRVQGAAGHLQRPLLHLHGGDASGQTATLRSPLPLRVSARMAISKLLVSNMSSTAPVSTLTPRNPSRAPSRTSHPRYPRQPARPGGSCQRMAEMAQRRGYSSTQRPNRRAHPRRCHPACSRRRSLCQSRHHRERPPADALTGADHRSHHRGRCVGRGER